MSSRALRRLQREEEERKQLAQLQKVQEQGSGESDEGSDGLPEPHNVQSKVKQNAFDFLNATEKGEDSELDEVTEFASDHAKEASGSEPDLQPISEAVSAPKRKKKAKKRKKGAKTGNGSKASEGDSKLDEIDLALKTLNTTDKHSKATEEVAIADAKLSAFYELLSTDSKHLNALNEMKKLFGNTVVHAERTDGDADAARRRGRGPVQLDLGAALAGRNSLVSRGQGLAGLALKRNVFVPGKEEWPRATSGGLGMELVEKAWDHTTEYRFVHSGLYQEVQRRFDQSVESMDPQRLIGLLQKHPYHISTLLQVAEIAKHQGDQSVSVDLLERALFTFGRSVHSSFHTALSQGKARLDFRRPENREFWLAAYQYIGTLGQRGTWRTAFEWAKLLLSLDPESDPYSIRLVIDQLAVRGGQFDQLLKLADTPGSLIDWGQYSPNVLISLAMAHHKLKSPERARRTLAFAVEHYPWIFARLYKELDIEPIPKSIWGRQARTDREELLSAAYVLRAKDIWNTPEALTLLKEVVDITDRAEPPPADSSEVISLNEARHILLSEMPTLIALLPRDITTSRTSSSDPLPPHDDLVSYTFDNESEDDEEWRQDMRAHEQLARRSQTWLAALLGRFGVNRDTVNADEATEGDLPIDVVAEELLENGIDISELANWNTRMEEFRGRGQLAEERLRALENDLNNINARAQEAGLTGVPAPAPIVNRAPSDAQPASSTDAQASSSQEPPSAPIAYDDEANQRWLAGRGMLRLKEFIRTHGSDENAWKDNLDIDITPATEYAHRITQLRKRASKDFILNYALKQGAGSEASDLIKRLVGS